MRIVKRREFLELPTGTVFMEYEPCIFGELQKKGDTCGDDFYMSCLTSEIDCNNFSEVSSILENAAKDSTLSINLDVDCYGRDGMYEEGQLFAVYEKRDIDNLIDALRK